MLKEPLKVRAKKHLSNLPNSNRKINPRSLNQKRDLQLSLGEMFGFKPKEEGVVSHSSSEISVSVDEDTVFFVALILLFLALFFGTGTSPTSPTTPSPTHIPTSMPTASPTISAQPTD